MTVSLTLDVAISLIFIFVLAALLASTVNEMISGMLKLRGVYLTKAIELLTSLDSRTVFRWGGVGGWFYAHFWQSNPSITADVDKAAVAITDAARAAAATTGATAASVQTAFTTAMAGYPALASRFTQVEQKVAAAAAMAGATADDVLAVIRPVGGIANLQSHPLLVGTPSSLPSYVPARDFAAALLSLLKDGSGAPPIVQARNAIQSLPDGDFKTELLAFIDAGANDIDKLRTRIENWFDDTMERLSGIYTRSTQYIMLLLGLIVAVGMNIDSIHLAKALWEEPAISKAISDGAAKFVTASGSNIFACPDATSAGGAAVSDNASAVATAGTGSAAGTDTGKTDCRKIDLRTIQTVIDQQTLPIGRTGTDFFGCHYLTKDKNGQSELDQTCNTAVFKGWTAGGWLVTAFAISLGAQFWFGLLVQLINIRAAGDKPDRANAQA